MKEGLFLAFVALVASIASSSHPKNELDSIGWLAGCWEGNYSNGQIISEQWMKPLGHIMMGMSRTVKNGKTIEYENVRLEQSGDGSIHYIAHPSGQAEASFTLVDLEGKRAVFENLQHDFPQRIIYRLISPDSLFARVEGTISGREKGSDFPYRRVKCE